MYKPNFTVVTCVLFVFALLAFAKLSFIGFIPPATTNVLSNSHQRFLSAAAHQQIKWHLIEEDAFAGARSSNRPVLLVIGVSGGRYGKGFDASAFEDSDTARYVAQNFYCIRIDGYEHPEWLNAVLPISRFKIGLSPAFQAWVLDSNGHVLNLIDCTLEGTPPDGHQLFRALVDAKGQYDVENSLVRKHSPIPDLQSADVMTLATNSGFAEPSLSAFAEVLGTQSDRKYGGFPRGPTQELYPNAWRFLTLAGYRKLGRDSLSPILNSKLVDIEYGGFFQLGLSRDIQAIEFDKGTRLNAEMMLTLSLQGQIDHDIYRTDIALSTFDWLARCAKQNGLFAACQEDDETPQGKSPRISFPLWRVHDVLDPPDRDWADDQLGLNPFKNVQMVPFLASPSTLLDQRTTFDRIITKLRSSAPSPPKFNDVGYLDVNGHTLARMLEVSRIWGDSLRLSTAAALISGLDAFKDERDLFHLASDPDHRHGNLGDFLALSDTRLQQYLATGNSAALEEGLHYLNLARIWFSCSHPGQLMFCRSPNEMGGIESMCVPEIADNVAESCTAQAIRLELSYGRLTADSAAGKQLIRDARQSTSAFADIAGRGGPTTAGYFCAAADVLDGRYAIAVGPDAESLADDLYRLVPTRFVAPALGQFRRDLQHRKPGIYVIGKSIQGPFTVAEAASRLPITLSNLGSL